MLPEDILSNAPVRLCEAERRHYFDKGYVAVDSAISSEWIERLRAATAELLEASRAETESRYACFDTRPCELPPDWGRTGYLSPWKLQQDAEERGTSAAGSK